MKRAFQTIVGGLASCCVAAACTPEGSDVVHDIDFGDDDDGSQTGAFVDVTMGADWDGDMPCDTSFPSELAVAAEDGELRVWFHGCFPCETQKHEAYVEPTDSGYDILFQPPELDDHNACGEHVYDMRLIAGPGEAGDTVRVFTRWERDADPVLRATAVASSEPVDCEMLTACDGENPCANEGVSMDERGDDYTMGCVSLDSCGGSFCIWDAEACMIECGSSTCGMMESYPLQPACDD